jgi:uncharacterized protein YqeY
VTLADDVAGLARQALKERDAGRLRVLRLLRTELQVAQASGREFREVDVVRSFARTLTAAAQEYKRLGHEARAEGLLRDAGIVEELLPARMSREDTEAAVAAIIEESELGPRDVGAAMKQVMARYGDVVDRRLAHEIVRDRLGGQV